MCLGVHANGFQEFSDKGAYVTVHVLMMKGVNDDSLQWPYQGNIYIELLNWREDSHHEKKVVKFEAIVSQQGYFGNRVTKGEKATRGKGIGKFIAHSDLNDESIAIRRQCLYNDMLCFRITHIYTK